MKYSSIRGMRAAPVAIEARMRKLIPLTFLAVVVALPLQARGKNESYISYDDGGTIVRTADDGRESDARVNLPVFPGDEVITNRRGRAEVRLADGNVLGIDRASAIRLRSVLDSYDGEANDTVLELRYGKIAVYRSGDATESLRLDTHSASYFAGREAVFSVDADAQGRDRVSVFDGSIEVRTPSRTSRVRAGESANVDDRGLYDLVSDDRYSADDFERWFLKRAERYGNTNSRYRFSIGARKFVNDWNAHGPAHHCAVGVGRIADKIEKLGQLLGMETVRVC